MYQEIKTTLHDQMKKSLNGLKAQLTKVRTGRASPNVLDGITVNYYGTATPLAQIGQVSIPEARLLQINPYDKSIIGEVEKAILAANLGLTPSNDGNFIRIPFPSLTEEKRKDIVKNVKKMGEESKVHVRNLRRDANEKIKKAEKGKEISEDDLKKYQNEIQEITDQYISQIDQIITAKEKEVLTI